MTSSDYHLPVLSSVSEGPDLVKSYPSDMHEFDPSAHPLTELDFHVTNRCNLTCSYCCYNSGGDSLPLPEMTTAEAIAVINAAKAFGLRSLHINGGEPLLRTDIIEIVAHARSLGVDVRVQTNGTFLSRKLANRLKDAGLEKIMISLDGSTKSTHEALRGNGTYQPTLEGIRVAVEAGWDVRVNAIATALNGNDLCATAELALALGAHAFSFYYFSPIGRGEGRWDLWIPPAQWVIMVEEFTASARALLDRYPGRNLFFEIGYADESTHSRLGVAELRKCSGGCNALAANRDYMIVRSDGEAFPCILFVNHDRFLGNVLQHGFANVWANSPHWQRFRGDVLRHDGCDSCSLSDACHGGCLGYVDAFESKLDPRCKPNEIAPLCPIAKYSVTRDDYAGASDDLINDEGVSR